MKPKVILRDQARYDISQIAANASGIIESLSLDVKGKTVLVKPSFVFPSRSPSARGVITQPEFVAGVATALKDAGASRVLVGESSVLGPARGTFAAVGVLPMIKGIAEPVYLDEEDEVDVDVDDYFVQKTFRIPKIWLDADVFVSLPKIKTNMFSGITLSIKNNLGMLRQYERLKYHDWRLHEKLADLFRIRPPDMVIADCIVAGEGQGPILAEPVELGLMVGSDNAVASDVVACSLTGHDLQEVGHLKMLIDKGYGPGEIGGIDIDNADLLKRGRAFRRPCVSLADLSPDLRVFQGKEFYCPWGCAGMVQGLMDPYVKQAVGVGLKPMNVILGKPIESIPDDLDPDFTMVIGDCAEEHKHRGHFISGCCPRPLDIALFVRRIQGNMGILEDEMSFAKAMEGLKALNAHNRWRLRRRLSGKKLEPIENHVSLGMAFKELRAGIELKRKK